MKNQVVRQGRGAPSGSHLAPKDLAQTDSRGKIWEALILREESVSEAKSYVFAIKKHDFSPGGDPLDPP